MYRLKLTYTGNNSLGNGLIPTIIMYNSALRNTNGCYLEIQSTKVLQIDTVQFYSVPCIVLMNIMIDSYN